MLQSGVLRDRVANLELEVRLISLEDGDALRQTVLRPGDKSWRFLFAPTSDFFHMGAFYADQLVSVVSFLVEPLDNAGVRRGETWRLRGMATDPKMQKRGVGGQLLEQGLAEVERRKGDLVWCYGRTSAGTFYQDHGFKRHGGVFDIPGTGLHALYIRQVGRLELSADARPRASASKAKINAPSSLSFIY
ncbi:GNAT family N-acetyltransferase [Bradyrhizobium genosp. P]|uniref:GNAT family N-acetyltransferase n=1 Tax=Bradyrhizobium genosp. P TaxID=83641 RepID=UPI003CF282B4